MGKPILASIFVSSALAVSLGATGLATAAPPQPAPPADPSSIAVESLPDGRLSLSAKGARLADVLQRLGEAADFEVAMNEDVERPPVWATIRASSPEEAVRRILRRRSYALVFTPDGGLERVVVLSPADPKADEKRRLAERRRQAEIRAQQHRLQASVRARRANAR